MLHVLRVDVLNDGFERHGINHLLKSVLLTVDLVVLLDMEEHSTLCVVLNFWIDDPGPFDAPTFEVLDSGGKTHFGLGEHDREETVLASSFGGNKMARKCHKLVDEVSN